MTDNAPRCQRCGAVLVIGGGTDDLGDAEDDGQTWYWSCPVCDGGA